MKINRDDVVKFYELLRRYNITSTNIGIVGDSKRFKLYTDAELENISNDAQVYCNYKAGIVRIINDDMEISYVQVEDEKDLIGRYFRKFV